MLKDLFFFAHADVNIILGERAKGKGLQQNRQFCNGVFVRDLRDLEAKAKLLRHVANALT